MNVYKNKMLQNTPHFLQSIQINLREDYIISTRFYIAHRNAFPAYSENARISLAKPRASKSQ